ncbi:MAG: class II SORL domain-containing protein [Proteobacteria bacterium]|nr:class II SORL domain-containing protein [Pseudomonadota bacterium]MBU4010024.1 class II SORL domain-containing protein [Pseudomonadota bacterium]MBU4035856.1 class II SORL domain-containing protein [Pseudomonadota bacterium]
MKKIFKLISWLSVFLFLSLGTAYANKASVTIDVPYSAVKDTEVTIKLNIMHNGNNIFHHTEWVYVKVNGKEIARWDFSMTNLPETENFTREVKYTINEPVQIEAEASCNIHGSGGITKAAIDIK